MQNIETVKTPNITYTYVIKTKPVSQTYKITFRDGDKIKVKDFIAETLLEAVEDLQFLHPGASVMKTYCKKQSAYCQKFGRELY
jgi:hypothetical protein